MSLARGLFLSAAGIVSLTVAVATPWQNTSNLDLLLAAQDNVIMGPGSPGGSETTLAARMPDASTSTALAGARDEPPELVTVVRRSQVARANIALPSTSQPLLAQHLQRELVRVGCYEGEVNGAWTPATRRAMKAFTDRVNATLPTDEPDFILLSLVQAAQGKVCGTACPVGEAPADDGRCMPNAVLAGKKMPHLARAHPVAAPTLQTEPANHLGPTGQSGVPVQPADPLSQPAIPAAVKRSDARRSTSPPQGFFGNGIFKQFEKLGF